jgi:hypothetical protein
VVGRPADLGGERREVVEGALLPAGHEQDQHPPGLVAHDPGRVDGTPGDEHHRAGG